MLRFKTTIRVDRKLWHTFMENVKDKHLSTCHVLEALMNAWVFGGSIIPSLGQPMTLNLTMQHVVSRSRRSLHVSAKKIDPKEGNHYTVEGGWFFDSTLEEGVVKVEQPRSWKGGEKGFTWFSSDKGKSGYWFLIVKDGK